MIGLFRYQPMGCLEFGVGIWNIRMNDGSCGLIEYSWIISMPSVGTSSCAQAILCSGEVNFRNNLVLLSSVWRLTHNLANALSLFYCRSAKLQNPAQSQNARRSSLQLTMGTEILRHAAITYKSGHLKLHILKSFHYIHFIYLEPVSALPICLRPAAQSRL